jgi:hypothetical protein
MNAATIRKIKARRRKEQELRVAQQKAKFFLFYIVIGLIMGVSIFNGWI